MAGAQESQLLGEAMKLHRAGRLGEAEKLYRQILASFPNNDGVLVSLGLLAGQTNRNQEAIDLISEAIAINLSNAAYHCNLGAMLQRAGRIDGAIAALRRAVEIEPSFAEAWCNLGNVLRLKGNVAKAIAAYRKALELRPGFAAAERFLKEAESASPMRNAQAPTSQTFNDRGIALAYEGRVEEAVSAFREAAAMNPKSADAQNNLGNALVDIDQADEAMRCFQTALRLKPDFPASRNGLGMAMIHAGKIEEGITELRRILAVNPNFVEAMNNLANALMKKREMEQCLKVLDRAIELRPDFPGAHYNRAHALLLLGDFAGGWQEYEWRRKAQKRYLFMKQDFAQPQWRGEPLEGKTIFLHAEQGLGDTLQFLRFIPLVAGRGGKIILGCQTDILCMLNRIDGIDRTVTTDQKIPKFDVHCPLVSLPLALGTRLESIPANMPYLHPEKQRVHMWGDRLGEKNCRLRVGLAWAGNPFFRGDRTRSMHISQLGALSQAHGVEFFSLQKGAAAGQATAPAPGLSLIDLGPELKDFADTAAVMSHLDLILSTDTSVPHLAGALGKPVWTMLQYSPDWRWLLGREDSPWYPTMRLFRQKQPGDWESVVKEVAAALCDFKGNANAI
jgi:tetratricopeptide (TPR) repeat protein